MNSTDTEDKTTQSWAPRPPDVTFSQVMKAVEPSPFRTSGKSRIYRFKDIARIFKTRASPYEFRMMQLAGDCSVKAYGQVLSLSETSEGAIDFRGIVMDLETPVDRQLVKTLDPKLLMRQMVSCLDTLHSTYKMVHGDVKPSNMLWCLDGRLRFCDFAESRRIDEDPSKWHGNYTVNFLAPNRSHHWFDNDVAPAPTISDDWYSLGLSIWQIYTGRVPFAGQSEDDIVEILLEGGSVDVNLILDSEVREMVRGYLEQGGATSFVPAAPC